MNNTKKIRTFETGATRNSDQDKLDFDGVTGEKWIKAKKYIEVHKVTVSAIKTKQERSK